ncbi:MAG: hypothetical protein MPEBLZ_04466 [Candidatus Methanoperedens nitroreducens]|uniref:Uncharacterized protein n=1 Tax=Candidatus Methanoperedens nitratireducens TaxID=1392998 RepID=A0A0P7ZZH4_9EURY|nr:hypothetical protein [Candidatus Methanoperedens sp. BLZ2]KAB2942391.1 MAG: hypothetical protein F9K14_17225 [Candidatus Methanoperedens sp.]KPQ40992.1 MAG: hypothetical protein MPEBLZ_04466 [Candidatus Methanoperedens sp. BLZ1]MBZ0176669.1 hypothetical protein [Candidatus Methanoperedens nitroreducens]MCX9080393.1 hypothetical protein [Candidatus Methanoperedens sp.]
MTYNVNGIGTNLSGERKITVEELVRWSEYLPIKPYTRHPEFYIATESFVVLFLPIIPIETFVHYYPEEESGHKYIISYYPVGEGKIYWEHIKSSYVFYIVPAIISTLLVNYLIGILL